MNFILCFFKRLELFFYFIRGTNKLNHRRKNMNRSLFYLQTLMCRLHWLHVQLIVFPNDSSLMLKLFWLHYFLYLRLHILILIINYRFFGLINHIFILSIILCHLESLKLELFRSLNRLTLHMYLRYEFLDILFLDRLQHLLVKDTFWCFFQSLLLVLLMDDLNGFL